MANVFRNESGENEWASIQKSLNWRRPTHSLPACTRTSNLRLVKDEISKKGSGTLTTTTLSEHKCLVVIDESQVNIRKLICTQNNHSEAIARFSLTQHEHYQYVIVVHSSLLLIGSQSICSYMEGDTEMVQVQVQVGPEVGLTPEPTGVVRSPAAFRSHMSALQIEMQPVGMIWGQQCNKSRLLLAAWHMNILIICPDCWR